MKLRKLRIYSLFLALLICLGITGCTVTYTPAGDTAYTPAEVQGELEVHFIDVGQADAALLLCGGESLLIDGGNVDDSSRIVTYLRKLGVSHIDAVVCTHGHEDHVGGLSGALSSCSTGRVISSCESYPSRAFENFLKYTEKQGLRVELPEPGERFSLGDAQVTILGPVSEYEEENDNSVMLRVDFGNTSFLFTGDAQAAAEEDVMNTRAELSADVLKVGHHGSSSSTSYRFLREVMPKYAVISCGADNSYGHPHDEVLSRLRDVGAQLYRTDMQGDVIAKSDGESIVFTTSKNPGKNTNTSDKTTEQSRYIGNRKSKKFHRTSCASLLSPQNSVSFTSRSDALEQGYSPCGSCSP